MPAVVLFYLIFFVLFCKTFYNAMRDKELNITLLVIFSIITVLGFFYIIPPVAVGIIGVILTLVIALFLNARILSTNNINYPVIEIFASTMIVISLTKQFNLPSILQESIFVLIAIFGLFRIIRMNKRIRAEKKNKEVEIPF